MRRALSRLSSETFDLLIVGGGASGAFTARDASLRGLKVALVEARDFAGATSAHNSKLAHGGLRYLRTMDFRLVRESLVERGNLLRMAPHLVRPLPFLLPVTGGLTERMYLGAGLTLYDLMAGGDMPRHRWLKNPDEKVLADFNGAFEYHDAQMYAPERIALECLVDADAHGAAIANYCKAEKLLQRNGRVEGISVRDAITGDAFDIRANVTLVAAGPWADLFLAAASGKPATHRLVRSKGIHILVPSFSEKALTIEAGGGHFFVMPWRGHSLVGTTDTPFAGDPATLGVSEADIAGLIGTVNQYLPQAHLARDAVEFFYAGLRPLVADGSADTYGVSRKSELVDHAGEGLDGVFSALGGKWTTSRALAQSVTDAVVKKLGAKASPCVTAKTPLPGGRFEDFASLAAGIEKTWPGISMRHLIHMFGARLPLLLKNTKVADLAALGPSGDTMAQVDFAVREEMALSLEDVVMRRTSLGQFGPPPNLNLVAARMAALLGWNAAKTQSEIESLAPLYRTVN